MHRDRTPGTDSLVQRVPLTARTELAETLATLATLGPVVAEALGRVHVLTGVVEDALGAVTDDDVAAVHERLGVSALWRHADAVLAAHPDHACS
jgi:hypothetical protein